MGENHPRRAAVRGARGSAPWRGESPAEPAQKESQEAEPRPSQRAEPSFTQSLDQLSRNPLTKMTETKQNVTSHFICF